MIKLLAIWMKIKICLLAWVLAVRTVTNVILKRSDKTYPVSGTKREFSSFEQKKKEKIGRIFSRGRDVRVHGHIYIIMCDIDKYGYGI